MNNGKICVSVCAETVNEFIEKIEQAAKNADVVELRFDCINADEFDCLEIKKLDLVLSRIFRAKTDKPLLSTFRPKEQGGKRQLSEQERLNFWNMGYDSCWADLEPDVFENSLYWLYQPKICSHHDFSGTPKNLTQIYNQLKSIDCVDIIKIAVQADDVIDGLALMKLLERAKAENRELIPIAMGESGVWTRILGLSRGAFMTFAALDEESATAPGQLTAQEMIDVYRVRELDETTEIYGLVAESVAYSVSPQMHNAAFKFHKLNAVYVPFAVKNLEDFVRRMVKPKTREIDWNFRGFSITIPHKIEIMKHLDFVDETAQKIGAVNTVKIEGDELLGFNTDADGFIEPLKNAYGDLNGARVAVFGAGGAARACVYALQRDNANVTVFARNSEKAKSLAADFGVEIQDLQSQIEHLKNFDVVVNATPLGMKKGGLENETPATAEHLEGVRLVYDLVYNPFETKLMREAGKVFAPTIGGLAMLVAQAAAQQKIWTGLDVPIKEMSAAALRKLNK
jgi:3-dehydroquinate dehydratase/shikimate dehydrogenase